MNSSKTININTGLGIFIAAIVMIVLLILYEMGKKQGAIEHYQKEVIVIELPNGTFEVIDIDNIKDPHLIPHYTDSQK